ETVEAGQYDQRPARDAQPAAGRLGRAQPAEERQECERTQETKEDAAHARFEGELLTADEQTVRRTLRRDAIEQSSQQVDAVSSNFLRSALQAAGEPEGQHLLRLTAIERGAFALPGVDAQLAQRIRLGRGQLVILERLVGVGEQPRTERWIGDGALEH